MAMRTMCAFEHGLLGAVNRSGLVAIKLQLLLIFVMIVLFTWE